uniref:Uncharacterized protein n=1 Tax=Oryza brachyantha TaxID=4533 RepID=J3M9J9_ORYBR
MEDRDDTKGDAVTEVKDYPSEMQLMMEKQKRKMVKHKISNPVAIVRFAPVTIEGACKRYSCIRGWYPDTLEVCQSFQRRRHQGRIRACTALNMGHTHVFLCHSGDAYSRSSPIANSKVAT